MNEATTLGIAAINKSRQNMVESQAVGLINNITAHQKAITVEVEAIKGQQDELKKIASDVVDQRSVIGTEWTGSLNMNQVTILNAIKKINESRQGQVELKGQKHINAIESSKDSIKRSEEAIAKLREEMAKLSVDVIDAASVAGH